MLKKFFSFFLASCFLVCLCCPASSASSFGVSLDGAGIVAIADWVADNIIVKGTTQISNWIEHLYDQDTCPQSVEANGRHKFVKMNTSVDGKQGIYYICEACGQSAGEVFDKVESEYVASLPAQTVTSDGSLIWRPTLSDVSSIDLTVINYTNSSYTRDIKIEPDSFSLDLYDATYYGIAFTKFDESKVSIRFHSMDNSYPKLTCRNISLHLPMTGTYSCVGGDAVVGVYTVGNSDTRYNWSWGASSLSAISLDKTFSFNQSICSLPRWGVFDGYLFLPVFSIVPETPYIISSTSDTDTYNIGTRAASITGNYGVVNSNGTVTQVESQSIVNEGDSTVYNPVTNETHSMADWSYDYSDRSYHVTTEQGDTLTVTYGDENVTIQEGDNVYNVYYITNTSSGDNEGGNSGSGETPTPTHTHNYTSDITSAPTCTLPGVRTFSCSCGASYTQQIAPAGHTWEVKNHVNMEYDAEGELLQQGYTVYRCSVCGEEYRSPDDSLPPGLMETDNQLAEVSNKVLAWYNSLRELYQGYVGFLTDAFRFLPDELVALIEFGIGSSFVIAVSKKLLR